MRQIRSRSMHESMVIAAFSGWLNAPARNRFLHGL
jgi:hypothetical protein